MSNAYILQLQFLGQCLAFMNPSPLIINVTVF